MYRNTNPNLLPHIYIQIPKEHKKLQSKIGYYKQITGGYKKLRNFL